MRYVIILNVAELYRVPALEGKKAELNQGMMNYVAQQMLDTIKERFNHGAVVPDEEQRFDPHAFNIHRIDDSKAVQIVDTIGWPNLKP